MNDELETMTDAQLNEAVALEVAGWREIEKGNFTSRLFGNASGDEKWSDEFHYATSANEVLPLLEKQNCDMIFDSDRQWQCIIHVPTTGKFLPNCSNKSFARAACIALLRAKRGGA